MLKLECAINENLKILLFLQDIVYALAHATGRTGRFTLIERWRNNERLLAPQEHPLQVTILLDTARAARILCRRPFLERVILERYF